MMGKPFLKLELTLFAIALVLTTAIAVALGEARHHANDIASYRLIASQSAILQSVNSEALIPSQNGALETSIAEFERNLVFLSEDSVKWDGASDISYLSDSWSAYLDLLKRVRETPVSDPNYPRLEADILESHETLENQLHILSLILADHVATHRRQFEPLMMVFLLLALILFYVGFYTTRTRIIRPLAVLTNTARQFNAIEKYPTKTDATYENDEISHLESAFATMLEGFHNAKQELEALIAQRTLHLASAFDFTTKIVRHLEIEEIIAEVTRQLKGSLKADFVQVGLINDSDSLMEIFTPDGVEKSAVRLDSLDRIEPLRRTLNTGETVITSTVCEGCAHQRLALEGQCAVIPLPIGEHVIGTICVRRITEETFDSDEIRMLMLLGNSTAIALSNAHLIAAIRGKDQQMAAAVERERLSGDLHDNLAQDLSALRFKAAQIAENVKGRDNVRALHELRQVDAILDKAYVQIRQILSDLKISAPDTVDVTRAVANVLDEFRTELETEIIRDFPKMPLPEVNIQSQKQIVYVLREALTNIRRHAQATAVCVHLSQMNGFIRLAVTDNGVGFEPASINIHEHFGLTIMQTRAARVGGSLSVSSKKGTGTELLLSVPVSTGPVSPARET